MKEKIFPSPEAESQLPLVLDKAANSYGDNVLGDYANNSGLFGLFKAVHNHVYANDGLSTQQAFEEILKLLFAKIEDEACPKDERRFWISADEYVNAQSGGSQQFRNRIDGLFNDARRGYPDIFEESEKLKLSDVSLAFTVKHLQDYRVSDAARDIKGAAFQKFVSLNLRAERGQFFTPDPVINFMVEVGKPSTQKRFLDPACGTGGFLYSAIRYIRRNESGDGTCNCLAQPTRRNLNAIDINQSVARVAKLRLLLEGYSDRAVLCANSLSDWDNLTNVAAIVGFDGGALRGEYDLILTNPPFGSQGKITDRSVLRSFDLGHKWTFSSNFWYREERLLKGQSPEILFLERCIDFLSDGGVLGIVIPNGILENKSLKYVREYIRKRTKILASILLPPETFVPHGTGVRTSLLFLQRYSERRPRKETENDSKIFFAIATKIGYTGNKNATIRYNRDAHGQIVKDSKGRPIIDEDLSERLRDFESFASGQLIEKDVAYHMSFGALEDRLDANYYRPSYRRLRDKLTSGGAASMADLVDIVSEKSPKLKTRDNRIHYVELADVNPVYGELVSYREMYAYEAPSRASYDLSEGDLITAVAGNSTGTRHHASALVTKEFDGCICTNGFRVLRPKKVDPFYLLSFLRSDRFLQQMYQRRTGAAIPAVSDEDFRKILVPLPSDREQKRIAEKIAESYRLRLRSRKLLDEAFRLIGNR